MPHKYTILQCFLASFLLFFMASFATYALDSTKRRAEQQTGVSDAERKQLTGATKAASIANIYAFSFLVLNKAKKIQATCLSSKLLKATSLVWLGSDLWLKWNVKRKLDNLSQYYQKLANAQDGSSYESQYMAFAYLREQQEIIRVNSDRRYKIQTALTLALMGVTTAAVAEIFTGPFPPIPCIGLGRGDETEKPDEPPEGCRRAFGTDENAPLICSNNKKPEGMECNPYKGAGAIPGEQYCTAPLPQSETEQPSSANTNADNANSVEQTDSEVERNPSTEAETTPNGNLINCSQETGSLEVQCAEELTVRPNTQESENTGVNPSLPAENLEPSPSEWPRHTPGDRRPHNTGVNPSLPTSSQCGGSGQDRCPDIEIQRTEPARPARRCLERGPNVDENGNRIRGLGPCIRWADETTMISSASLTDIVPSNPASAIIPSGLGSVENIPLTLPTSPQETKKHFASRAKDQLKNVSNKLKNKVLNPIIRNLHSSKGIAVASLALSIWSKKLASAAKEQEKEAEKNIRQIDKTMAKFRKSTTSFYRDQSGVLFDEITTINSASLANILPSNPENDNKTPLGCLNQNYEIDMECRCLKRKNCYQGSNSNFSINGLPGLNAHRATNGANQLLGQMSRGSNQALANLSEQDLAQAIQQNQDINNRLLGELGRRNPAMANIVKNSNKMAQQVSSGASLQSGHTSSNIVVPSTSISCPNNGHWKNLAEKCVPSCIVAKNIYCATNNCSGFLIGSEESCKKASKKHDLESYDQSHCCLIKL